MKRPFTLKKEYPIIYDNTYYCTCDSFEKAHYVHQELTKCDYNKDQLQQILDNYPEYYTYLLNFYKHISWDMQRDSGWILVIPTKYTENNSQGTIVYRRLEDALFERDFLVKHEWDYEVLVECIDDTFNHYYNMTLPPYPTERIPYRWNHNNPKYQIKKMIKILKEEPDIYQYELARLLNVSAPTVRNWLKKYNTNWLDFKTLIATKDNPWDYLKFEKIITPEDTVRSREKLPLYLEYTTVNGVSKYRIYRKGVFYGVYDSYDLAFKIYTDLINCDWDKSQLNNIRKKHGLNVRDPSMKYIRKSKYNKYVITKKVEGRVRQFGSFYTLDEAKRFRDALMENGWNFNEVYL